MKKFDVLIVGAGVIGIATARAIATAGRLGRVAVLEKEPRPAVHTSGRNSGVIHSGINAKPGSLKARFCVEGNRRLRQFCKDKSLPMREVGTVVTALNGAEEEVLAELLKRGQSNGAEGVELVNREGLTRLEPHANGQAALYAPTGAIASGKAVAEALAKDAMAAGGEFFFGCRVKKINISESGVEVICENGDVFVARLLINCAGLYADKIAHQFSVALDHRIVPFRGEYHRLKDSKSQLLRSMLYPVPNLAYPFLGVHWTRTVAGDILIGPNATLAWSRESYSPFSFNVGEALEMATTLPFWRMFAHADFLKTMWGQLKISLSQEQFVAEARKLISGVRPSDFEKGKSGNRAQLVNSRGELVDDMLVMPGTRSVHVLNAVSPGFTCSLSFADHLSTLAEAAY